MKWDDGRQRWTRMMPLACRSYIAGAVDAGALININSMFFSSQDWCAECKLNAFQRLRATRNGCAGDLYLDAI